MLVAMGIFSAKRYLLAHQHDDELVTATPADYNRIIKRKMPLREAREQCGGPLHDNAGQPWPTSAGYLHKPKRRASGNLRRLTLDNQHNLFAVLVKLETPAAPQQLADVFIPTAGNFDVKVSLAEEHVLKIKEINSGCIYLSRPFTLDRNSDQPMSLKLQTGSGMPFQSISDREF